MSGRLYLLLLYAVLDGLGVNELLQLLLLCDEEVVLVGGRLGGHGVVAGGHVLAVDDGDGEVCRGPDELVLLVGQGLGGVGVEDRGDGLAVDNRSGEVGRGGYATEGVVGTEAGVDIGWELNRS